MSQDAALPAEVRRVVLIGFSCTGKSRVCSLLAQQLGWQPVDTDDLIVALAGKPIERIFAEDGETHFRAVEHEAVAQACAGERRVIATGGGAPVGEGEPPPPVPLQPRRRSASATGDHSAAASAPTCRRRGAPAPRHAGPVGTHSLPAGRAPGYLRARAPDGPDGHLAAGPRRHRHQGSSDGCGEGVIILTPRPPLHHGGEGVRRGARVASRHDETCTAWMYMTNRNILVPD